MGGVYIEKNLNIYYICINGVVCIFVDLENIVVDVCNGRLILIKDVVIV